LQWQSSTRQNFRSGASGGLRGVRELALISDAIILVDVFSFSTALDVATSRNAVIFPYPLTEAFAADYAAAMNAQLASSDRCNGFSLSPTSLRSLPAETRLVLPSPNGAALSFAIHHPAVLSACLRNAGAVARSAARLGTTFAVIPAGETWPTGELRPCLEDLLGAGAVIASLPGARSPEAELAVGCFDHFAASWIPRCGNRAPVRKELIDGGFERDVDLAAEFDVSANVPRLAGGCFVSS
jgi:2-phosphosulfolactate phosphatase